MELLIGKLIKTKSKPCTCRTGKNCAACKAQKVVQPQVIVEEPKRLPAPVTVTYFKPPQKSFRSTPTAVHFMEKSDRWGMRKRQTSEALPKRKNGSIYRWYNGRKALKERKKYEEYERKHFKKLIELEEAKQRAQSVPPPQEKKWILSRPKRYKSLPPPTKRKKLINRKEKSAAVKPNAQSKYVSVKKYKQSESMSNRCANCFYRACCKFYCYLNCIILFIVIVVLVL